MNLQHSLNAGLAVVLGLISILAATRDDRAGAWTGALAAGLNAFFAVWNV